MLLFMILRESAVNKAYYTILYYTMASALGHEGTRTNHGSRIFYITEKPVHQHAQNTTFGLLVEASLFWLRAMMIRS